MAALLKLLPLIVKYWPVAVLVFKAIRAARPMFDDLAARPETGVPEDVRDFMREASAKGKWQDDFWQKMQDESS